MKKLIFLALSLSLVSAARGNSSLHTEDNEQVCQMNDLLKTKIFVDTDYDNDGETGVLSSKLLEMPTQNAHGNNYRLFQVKLVKVIRSRGLGEKENQTILYTSSGNDSMIRKLEVKDGQAVLTSNVDQEGNPLDPYFIENGSCEPNEVP